MHRLSIAFVWMLFLCLSAKAQHEGSKRMSLEELWEKARTQNLGIKGAQLQTQQKSALIRSSHGLAKTDFNLTMGQFNSYGYDTGLGASQGFKSPNYYKASQAYLSADAAAQQSMLAVLENDLKYQISLSYEEMRYHIAMQDLLGRFNLLYSDNLKAADALLKAGQGTSLERNAAFVQKMQTEQQIAQSESALQTSQALLQRLTNTSDWPFPVESDYTKPLALSVADTSLLDNHPLLQAARLQAQTQQKATELEKANNLAEYSIGYNLVSIRGAHDVGDNSVKYFGFAPQFSYVTIGASVPLFNKAAKAKQEASKVAELVAQNNLTSQTQMLQNELLQLEIQLKYSQLEISFFEKTALPQADLIEKTALASRKAGEIGQNDWTHAVEMSLNIRKGYIEKIWQQNQLILKQRTLLGM